MAIKEESIIMHRTDESGNKVMQFPYTKGENIETPVPIANGGTGATTAANARTNLGLSTAVTDASISGKTITLTKANGTTQTLTTQDNGYHTGNATSIGGASATKPAGVVESYKNGYEWYRKYSDGWVEQGGKVPTTGLVVTLHKPMADNKYHIDITVHTYTNHTAYDAVLYGHGYGETVTTTKFEVMSENYYDDNYMYRTWEVKGQGA